MYAQSNAFHVFSCAISHSHRRLYGQFLYSITDVYDPTLIRGSYTGVGDVGSTTVCVNLDTMDMHSDGRINESDINLFIGIADGIITVVTPARPSSMDETIRLRFQMLNEAIKARGNGLLEGVAIMKDIEVPWGLQPPGRGQPGLTIVDAGSENRKKREEEWRVAAVRGYAVARRLGVEAHVVCPRTD